MMIGSLLQQWYDPQLAHQNHSLTVTVALSISTMLHIKRVE